MANYIFVDLHRGRFCLRISSIYILGYQEPRKICGGRVRGWQRHREHNVIMGQRIVDSARGGHQRSEGSVACLFPYLQKETSVFGLKKSTANL